MQNKTATELVAENQANISEWKEKHKQIKSITVVSKLNGKQPFIVGKPTNQVLDAVAKYEHEGKVHKINELLVGSCVLAGNTKLFEEDVDLKNAVLNKVTDLLERLEVEEKEL